MLVRGDGALLLSLDPPTDFAKAPSYTPPVSAAPIRYRLQIGMVKTLRHRP